MKLTIHNSDKQIPILILGLGLLGFIALCPEQAQASAAGGGGLPWETPLQTITRSLQGPVAYAISLLGIIACGGMLIWGGEINEFMRRGIMLVLVISLVILASNVLSTLFATGAGL
jgi:type IV secretory pathway VirB2 component (pilin)